MKILVVDDLQDARQVLHYMVEHHGHEAIEADNGFEALTIARSSPPDLIISDALMPVMDGFKLLRAMKQEQELRSIPFVLYSSAYKGDQDIRLAMSLGANAYFFKPMDPVELWDKIKGVLEKAKQNLPGPSRLIREDAEYLKRYSEVVATKLEEKVVELEKSLAERKRAEEKLASMNQQLESLVEKRTELLKRKNNELIASEKRYRNLVETMHEGILVVDAHGRLTYINQQMSNMLDMAPETLVGKQCDHFIEEGHREVFETMLKSTNNQFFSKFELNFTRSDGHIISTLVTPTHLYDGKVGSHGLFAVVTDITQLKRLQSQLLHAQKLESIGQLAAGIAHEINTPTQYVVNNLHFLDDVFKELIEMVKAHEVSLCAQKNDLSTSSTLQDADRTRDSFPHAPLYEEVSGAFQDTFEGLERISNIVDSVKRFALSSQNTTISTDLNEAIRNTITVSTNEWKYVADVTIDLDPALPLVPCNISDINQVILSLIVNAARAIESRQIETGVKEKGTITVKTAHFGNFAEIRVIDTGCGIPDSIRNRIFDPFFTTRSVGKGTGLGLAIARTIITNNHHGTIDFETEIGTGTTFVIRLPSDYCD